MRTPNNTRTRHCNCVYYHDWHRTKRPKRANDGGGLLLGVSHALSPLPPTVPAPGSAPSTPFTSPRNTLTSTSGVVVALQDTGHQSQGTVMPQSAQPATGAGAGGTGLPFDEEAKLVYGVILSLRNMIKRLSGRYATFPAFCLVYSFRTRVEYVPPLSRPGMNRLSTTAHPHTSYTFSKRLRATAS